MATTTTTAGGKSRKAVIKRAVPTEFKTLTDSAPPALIQLRQSLKASRWETNRKMLDIVALVCGTEQAWRAARSQILKLLNDEEAVTLLLVNRFGHMETGMETEQEIHNVV